MTAVTATIERFIMKRFLFLTLLALAGGPLAVGAADAFWINSGTVTTPPQVNATNFVNNGTITIATTLPFETSNTQNYTNRGTMTGSVGWKLHHAPTGNGISKAATVFHNHPQGIVTAVDGAASSKIIIAATNLINEGQLAVDAQGLMTLNGTNVNLKRGGVQVLPMTGQGSAENVAGTIFLPDVGIIDNYWGIGTNNINTAPILTRVIQANTTNWQALSPIHGAQNVQGGMAAQVLAYPAQTFVNITNGAPFNLTLTNSLGQPTNFLLITNYVVQAAFVETSGTNVGARARFFPSTQPTNEFQTISVELSATVNNAVTLQDDILTVYIVDRLASETNRSLATNLNVYPITYRPSPYLVSRIQPFEFAFGNGPNSLVTTNLLYDPRVFSNSVASAIYTAYGFTADRLAGTQSAIVGASITNIPGRIEINAGSLNLERTRFRSDGLVTVKTKHLITSTNANVDAFNLKYDLGSTNGMLRIQNLAKREVTRFGGGMQAWSGLWSNTSQLIITNNFAPDTNVPPNFVPSPITNTISYGFHVMIVDAGQVELPTPVTTLDFIARSTNVILADPLTITNQFFTDAQRFTVEGPGGSMILTNGVPNLTSDNTPNMRYFTNSGTIVVENEAHFGSHPVLSVPALTAFVNRSNITAQGINVRSTYFENAGFLDSGTTLAVDTTSGRMENGRSFTGGDLDVKASDFKLRNYTNESLGVINFTITNTLFDSGSTSPNRLVAGDGFHFQFANGTSKPTSGDLLGTSLETAAPIFASIEHTWPGDDRGVSTTGFSNNLALGRLVLSVGFEAEAVFAGAGTSNALYVDYLDFVGVDLAEVETALRTEANLVIYFADSSLPAEQLDGLLGGRLRWVKNYAGAYSSVDLLVNGQVIKVNRALRQSLTIDSDGDGLANGFDASPFDPAVLNLTVASAAPLTLSLNWMAAANTIYKLEYTTNHAQGWQLLKNYTNNAATAVPVSVLDQAPVGSPQRYYRVGYQP